MGQCIAIGLQLLAHEQGFGSLSRVAGYGTPLFQGAIDAVASHLQCPVDQGQSAADFPRRSSTCGSQPSEPSLCCTSEIRSERTGHDQLSPQRRSSVQLLPF